MSNGGVLSKDAAAKAQASSLFMEWDHDEVGRRVPNSARPFSLYTNPRTIGKESMGLGMYFVTVQFMWLLLLVFFVLGIYAMADASSNSVLGEGMTLMIFSYPTANNPRSLEKAVPCLAADEERSFVLDMSIGAYCSTKQTASLYNCPAVCSYTLQTYNEVPGDTCASHPPCNLDLPDELKGVCCDRSLDTSGIKEVPAGIFWLLFLCSLMFSLWSLSLRYVQTTTAQQINASTITAGDYTVYVEGLHLRGSGVTDTREEVAAFFSHYGEVSNVVFSADIGRLMTVTNMLKALRRQKTELLATAPEALGSCLGQAYLSVVSGFKGRDKKLAELDAKIEKLQRIESGLAGSPVNNMGEAFVTFTYEKHANNCFLDLRRSLFSTVYAAICFSSFTPKFKGRRLTVRRAPEPSDVFWENMDHDDIDLKKRRSFSLMCQIGIACVGAAIQFGFEVIRANERENILKERASNQFLSDVQGTDEEGFASTALEQARIQGLTVFASLMVVIINIGTQIATKFLAKYEKHQTRSNMERSIVIRLPVVQVINAVIVPFLVTSRKEWYTVGGFFEQAFYTQLFNAFLPDIIALIDFPRIWKQYLMPDYVQTQDQMLALFEPKDFILAEKYASALKTITFALLFGPVLPISYLIALAGLVCTFWSDKYQALRRCRAPRRLNADTATAVQEVMRFFGLIQILAWGMYFWYDDGSQGAWVTSLIVYILMWVLPIQRCFFKRDRELEEGGTDGLSYTHFICGNEQGMTWFKEQDNKILIRDKVNTLRQFAPDALEPQLEEIYAPVVENLANSQQLTETLMKRFTLFAHPVPANPELLPGQLRETGDAAAMQVPISRGQQLRNMARMQPQGYPAPQQVVQQVPVPAQQYVPAPQPYVQMVPVQGQPPPPAPPQPPQYAPQYPPPPQPQYAPPAGGGWYGEQQQPAGWYQQAPPPPANPYGRPAGY